ncbi:hypothetical protein STIAU_8403 [Stigmatella aurantiaca DW4/3-1]|uniref:Uncharacterized protein n=1 Tax=Stigmatella aurantiaca (strain DW4/3-1) TaxID=378806 RepID=Q09E45_STIAD|nr:hypothetical protein STIAU_8403 [Stigmatella aurantiaca DW4/3-1]
MSSMLGGELPHADLARLAPDEPQALQLRQPLLELPLVIRQELPGPQVDGIHTDGLQVQHQPPCIEGLGGPQGPVRIHHPPGGFSLEAHAHAMPVETPALSLDEQIAMARQPLGRPACLGTDPALHQRPQQRRLKRDEPAQHRPAFRGGPSFIHGARLAPSSTASRKPTLAGPRVTA